MSKFWLCISAVATVLVVALPTSASAASHASSGASPSSPATDVATRSVDAPADDPSDREPRMIWPLDPRPRVVRQFDPPDSQYGSGHRGVDLAARSGQRVFAAAPGSVVFAGTLAGRGVVSIDHGYIRTTYEPVKPTVKTGDQVYQGQQIGVVVAGHPGCHEAACLHWGAREPGSPPTYVNPLTLIAETAHVRLKPWDGS